MIRKPDPNDVVALGLVALATVASALVYPRLPARMPTHFDVHGDANDWMARELAAFLLPAVTLGLWALLRLGAAMMPRGWRERQERSPMARVAMLTSALLVALHLVVLRAALAERQSIGGAPFVLLGVFFVALGQILPRVRRNPWIGVRTAWTLSSDENWARSQRVGGYAMTLGGVAVACAGLANAPVLALAALLACAIAPAVYSFVLARKLPPEA